MKQNKYILIVQVLPLGNTLWTDSLNTAHLQRLHSVYILGLESIQTLLESGFYVNSRQVSYYCGVVMEK